MTVKEEWGMCCPKCGSDDTLDICAKIWVRLTPEGSDPDEATDTSHDWDSNSLCRCAGCQ